MRQFNDGDKVKILHQHYYGIKCIIIGYKGLNDEGKAVYWLKRQDGKEFERDSHNRNGRRNNNLEASFWCGWLVWDNKVKYIKQYGIVKFMEAICVSSR